MESGIRSVDEGPRVRGAPLCAAWIALLALLAGGCVRSNAASARALDELDELAFVPAGRVSVGAQWPILLYECPAPLLVERYESTRARWRAFAAEEPSALAAEMLARVRSWGDGQDHLPATWMTQPEARRFAAWRGMRLLAPGEWLFAALGQERRPYPWHTYERQDSIANTLDLGLGRPCPVGTFEGGRTPLEIYDLLGNVAEWVSGSVLNGAAQASPAELEGSGESRISALGGSFRSWLRPIYGSPRSGEPVESAFLAYQLHPLTRQDDVGQRCAALAETYLERQSALWGRDERALERLRAIGERWGRAAAPLLRELAERPGAAPGLRALLEGAGR